MIRSGVLLLLCISCVLSDKIYNFTIVPSTVSTTLLQAIDNDAEAITNYMNISAWWTSDNPDFTLNVAIVTLKDGSINSTLFNTSSPSTTTKSVEWHPFYLPCDEKVARTQDRYFAISVSGVQNVTQWKFAAVVISTTSENTRIALNTTTPFEVIYDSPLFLTFDVPFLHVNISGATNESKVRAVVQFVGDLNASLPIDTVCVSDRCPSDDDAPCGGNSAAGQNLFLSSFGGLSQNATYWLKVYPQKSGSFTNPRYTLNITLEIDNGDSSSDDGEWSPKTRLIASLSAIAGVFLIGLIIYVAARVVNKRQGYHEI